MEGRKISVLIKEPGKPPRHVNISNKLENLQRTVGGFIETYTIFKDLVVICYEEAVIDRLPFNCHILGAEFFGTVIICGISGDDFSDLPCDWATLKKRLPELWETGK